MAAERERADVAEARQAWITRRQTRMRAQPARLIFVDETAVTTKMVRLRGRALRGKRLPGAAPFGHWHTQIPAYARTGSSSPACAATR